MSDAKLNYSQEPIALPELNEGQVRALLSDLLDIRRGELPQSTDTPLSDPEYRAAVETFIEQNATLKKELVDLERIGLLFRYGNETAPTFNGVAERIRVRLAAERKAAQFTRAPQLKLESRAPAARVVTIPFWKNALKIAVPTAAAIFLGVLVFLRFTDRSGTDVASKDSDRIKTSPVSQANAELANPLDLYIEPQPRSVPRLSGPTSYTVLINNAPRKMKAELFPDGAPQGVDRLNSLLQNFERLRVTEDLDSNPRGLLGVTLQLEHQPSDGSIPGGLYVAQVHRNSPGERAGLSPGIVIQGLNDLKFEENTPEMAVKFLNALNQLGKGERVIVKFARPTGAGWWITQTSARLGEYE